MAETRVCAWNVAPGVEAAILIEWPQEWCDTRIAVQLASPSRRPPLIDSGEAGGGWVHWRWQRSTRESLPTVPGETLLPASWPRRSPWRSAPSTSLRRTAGKSCTYQGRWGCLALHAGGWGVLITPFYAAAAAPRASAPPCAVLHLRGLRCPTSQRGMAGRQGCSLARKCRARCSRAAHRTPLPHPGAYTMSQHLATSYPAGPPLVHRCRGGGAYLRGP